MTLADSVREPAPDGAETTASARRCGASGRHAGRRAGPALVEADLLVEDVSIDGMCGVY